MDAPWTEPGVFEILSSTRAVRRLKPRRTRWSPTPLASAPRSPRGGFARGGGGVRAARRRALLRQPADRLSARPLRTVRRAPL